MAQTQTLGTHKTVLFVEDGWTKVIYHQTCIVKWNDKQIVLNNGGYYTATTKTRMNQASNQFDLGYRVYQKDFEWFVDYKGQTFEFGALFANDTVTIWRETNSD